MNIRLLVLGDAGTGKSELIHQYIGNKINDPVTISRKIDIRNKISNIGNKKCTLQFIELAEKYPKVVSAYVRPVNCICLVYNGADSFDNIPTWLKIIKNNMPEDKVIMLIDNRSNVKVEKVPISEAQTLATKENILFMEVSELNDVNVIFNFIINVTVGMINQRLRMS